MLLNVASGRFDGCHSRRFKGIAKKPDEVGFKLLPLQEQESVVGQISSQGHNTFEVPSFTSGNVSYTVGMNIGLCECTVGQNGDVCKHQYVLWAFKLSERSNFLPYLSPVERQQYADIAIRETMPIAFYEGIHDRVV